MSRHYENLADVFNQHWNLNYTNYKFDANKLEGYDLLFIKTNGGNSVHISVDGITFCKHGAGLITTWDKNYNNIYDNTKDDAHKICWECKTGVKLEYDPEYIIARLNRFPKDSRRYTRQKNRLENWNRYQVTWQCCATISKKNKNNKNKKLKRCSKWAYSPSYNICTQHEKYYLKYIYQYISVCDDVSKIIIAYL